MAGYNNFQVDRNKYTTGIKDTYKKKKKVNFTYDKMSKEERLREGFKIWTAYFRHNPHRFAEEYFGIKLHLFQKILLYMAFSNDFFMYLASRGQGKSWLIAVLCCIQATLWPSTRIILSSGTKGQAQLIITEKIEKDLYYNYPNLAREIKEIKRSTNQCIVIFQNGSTIQAVTSTDTSRGYRGTILILDEFRLISEENLQKILRPFLNVTRQPPYLKKPEYAHLQEENKEIYISSAWYKNHWIYSKFNAFKDAMVRGKDYFVCGLPYQLSLEHNLLSKKRIEQMMSESDFNSISWYMEMECMFFGESEKAFFKLDDLQKCRTLIKPFYPLSNTQYLENKNKRKKSMKKSNEYRIIGVDVAMMGGNENDNTIFTCLRMLPNRDSFVRQVVYIESMNGQHSERQAIRLKQLFEDFEADYVVMDTAGNGLSLYDDCSRILYDTERDVEYNAWCAMNNEEMRNRSLDENALPIIYSVKVVQQQVNHEMAMFLKTCFEKKKIRLLVEELHGRDYLIEKDKTYIKSSSETQVNMELPYIQTTALVNELVNLEYEIRGGYVKLKETGSARKDRYSSLAYANYYTKILENELKEDVEINVSDYLLFN